MSGILHIAALGMTCLLMSTGASPKPAPAMTYLNAMALRLTAPGFIAYGDPPVCKHCTRFPSLTNPKCLTPTTSPLLEGCDYQANPITFALSGSNNGNDGTCNWGGCTTSPCKWNGVVSVTNSNPTIAGQPCANKSITAQLFIDGVPFGGTKVINAGQNNTWTISVEADCDQHTANSVDVEIKIGPAAGPRNNYKITLCCPLCTSH